MTNPLERAFVWTGGALFVASLAFTAWTYAVTFAASRPGPNVPAFGIDVLLLSVFALHHSLFARPWMKTRLARVLPDHLLRSVYVWVASLLLFLVCVLWKTIGGELLSTVNPWAIALHASVQLAGVLLIAASVRAIDALELAGITGADGAGGAGQAGRAGRAGRTESETGVSEHLQVHGPYRLVRHPLYLGWMLIVFGPSHLTGDRLAFALITSLYLIIAIPWEERSLEETFGDSYARYRQTVRWRVVPGIY